MKYYSSGEALYICKDESAKSILKNTVPSLYLIEEEQAAKFSGPIYFISSVTPYASRGLAILSHSSHLYEKEGVELLNIGEPKEAIPTWLSNAISSKKVFALNPSYGKSLELPKNKWRVNIVGLGDVGGILASGLRLLGGDIIETLGLYDLDEAKTHRWVKECGQISSVNGNYPRVTAVDKEELYNCDLLVFCVTLAIPPLGTENLDVRLVQFKGNAKIAASYAEEAAQKNYRGIFAVVSDPVDLLCSAALEGSLRGGGLLPEQIRGYGLGVMNARAQYYALLSSDLQHYAAEGRAFGPHGEGLIIADSIENYNEEKSLYLTEKAQKANLEIRKLGFKPYIAPALSSGALSLLDTMRGNWNYSSTFLGGVFFGCKNVLHCNAVELETHKLPDKLMARLKNTYNYLGNLYDEQRLNTKSMP